MKFDRIRMLTRRARLNMTQEALAAAARVSLRSVAAWEAGTQIPTLRMVNKLGDALDVSSDWLLGNDSTRSADPVPPAGGSTLREDGTDPPLPTWGRDLFARLCSLSPSLRDKAVTQFHLTLDLLISANSESVGRYSSGDSKSGIDPLVASRASEGLRIARERVLAQPGGLPTVRQTSAENVRQAQKSGHGKDPLSVA